METNIFVPETVESMFAPHNSGKGPGVFSGSRIESPVRPVVLPDRFSKLVKFPDSDSQVFYCGEGINVASVGGGADFGVAPEMGNAFGHGKPPQGFPPFTYTLSLHFDL